MPFVLQHTQTSQIFTCMLVNHYDLPYYGTKYWETAEEIDEAPAFLEANGISDTYVWKPFELTNDLMKLCNVKLKNDPSKLLFWENDRPVVKAAK